MDGELVGIRAGDEVRILQWTRHRSGAPRRYHLPPGGAAGRVTRTGKRYGWAVFEEVGPPGGEDREREIAFELETGIVRADTDGYYVRTPGQLELAERAKMALFILENHGITISTAGRRALTTTQLEELAAVVKAWEARP